MEFSEANLLTLIPNSLISGIISKFSGLNFFLCLKRNPSIKCFEAELKKPTLLSYTNVFIISKQ